MKKLFVLVATVALLVSPSFAVDEDSWFDMENCAVCKNMAPVMDSMHLITWDSKPLSNGLVTITAMPDELKAKWKKAKSAMDATVKKLEGGKKMKCCGFCQSFGSLVEAGAKKEEVKTAAGDIMMLTSDNPKVVAKIHEHLKKTDAAHAEMQKMMKEHGAGHDKDSEHGKDGEHDEHDGHDKDGEHDK